MNTIQPNQVPNPAGLQGIPGAAQRVAPPAAPAPQAPADQVTLNPAAPVPQAVQTKSGIQAQVLRNQQALAFQAALPAGALLPAPILVEGAFDAKGSQVQAFLAGDRQAALPAGVGTDGRVYVQIEPGAPLVSFDPVSMDYGLSAPLTVDASGTQHRSLQEIIHADGSRTVTHDEHFKPGPQGTQEHTFTRIDLRDGRLDAARVTAQEGGQAQKFGAKDVGMAMLTGGMSLLMGGANKPQETALTATQKPDGSIALGGGSFMDHAKKSATGGMRFDSPLMNWWKGRNAPEVTVVPFSAVLAANPGAVFPGLMAAAARQA